MEARRARRLEGTRRDCRSAYNPRGFAMKTVTVGLGGFLLIAVISLTAAAQAPSRPWIHPMTAWGDPDLTGMWPVTHLNGTPVQRPAQFGDRRLLTDQEFNERQKQIALTTERDRKSTRLNSSHSQISYAVFCLKKKKK